MNNTNNEILIIDDDSDVRALMSGVLTDEGYSVQQAANESEAISQIKKSPSNLIFLDLWMDNDESAGLKILGKIKQINPEIPVIIISGHGTIDVAMQAIQSGAFDFMEKPFVTERLLLTCERALETAKLRNENISLKNDKFYSDVFSLGSSLFAISIKSTIEKLATSNGRVFINASIGTCAESLAYKIHKKSSRKNKNFMYVNCISDDSERFEHELFGSEKSYGYFEKASEGTIFLEEIDKLSKTMQRNLLMFLQNGKYTCGNRVVYPDVRIICSSSKNNIMTMIQSGDFSNELFYRLKISEIDVPNICERREDIIPIVKYYLSKSEQLFGLPSKAFSAKALAILQSYEWPGNIYQIRNVVENSLINALGSSDKCVNEEHISAEITATTMDKFESLNVAKLVSLPLKEAKDSFESDYLRAQIQRFSGNISQTAIFIGMERSALHRKLKNLNVHVKKGTKEAKRQ